MTLLLGFWIVMSLAGTAMGQQKITVCASGCNQKTINQAIAAAACGSRIVLSSLETYYGGDGNRTANNPIRLQYKTCAPGNPIVITTDQDAKLPAPGTRITPNYADGQKRVVPLILNPGRGPLLITDLGNEGCGKNAAPCPAHDYQVIGLEFCCSSDFSDFVAVGARGNGSDERDINTLEDLPKDITFDRILVRADPLKNMRRCLTVDGVNVTVENSWIECGFDYNASDSQAIAGFSSKNLKILNNYIAGSTETLLLSGACSPIRTPVKSACSTAESGAIPTDVEIAFNEVTKPAWVRLEAWEARRRFPKGQIVHPANDTAMVFRAQNEGVTADKEPNWQQVAAHPVKDGQITWEKGDTPQAKNLFEAKSADGVRIHDNYFHDSWPQGQQGYAITLTTRTGGAGTFGMLRDVHIENNVVADVGSGINTSASDADNDINAIAAIMPSKSAPYEITGSANRLTLTINGTREEIILPVRKLTAQQVANAINPQITPAIACVIDDRFVIRARKANDASNCRDLATSSSGRDTSISVEASESAAANAVLGFQPGMAAASCFNPRTNRWYGCGSFDGLTVVNNVWSAINVEPNRAGVPYVFALFNRLNHVTFAHNTVDADPSGTMRMFFLESVGMPESNVSIRDNILGFREDNPHPITQDGTLYDFSAINYMLCNVAITDKRSPKDSLCPSGVVTHNVMPGVKLWKSTTRDTRPFSKNSGYDSYPSDNWDDTWNSLRFADAKHMDYTLEPSPGKFRATSPQGSAAGADMKQIPLIHDLDVKVSRDRAVFSFSITQPMAKIPCVMRVSPSEFFEAVIPDLDPSRFNQPDTSGINSTGLTRTMTAGSRAPLTPATTYYYQLSCGGATRYGSFETAK